ncbi:hypothetical protein [Intestinimonas timonensis]|uniref:hypothetical protein n=1 Tax=Intestinimonas timonensis TaxID=1689270 RepID=UPI0013EF1183|nr:hypothetical protein [Intestinimonas timonensis]
MSSKRIKGITVEIGGDTTKLDKALESSNKTLSQTQKTLKDVERLLKLDPGNTELLAMKQRLLAEAAQASADKLNILQEAAAGADAALQRGKDYAAKYEPLKAQLDQVTASLRGMENNAASMEEKFSKGKISTQAYENFNRKLEETRKNQEDLQKAIRNLGKEFAARLDMSQYDALQLELADTAMEAEDLEEAAKQSADGLDELGAAAKDASDKAGKISEVFAPVTKGVAALGAAAVATVPATEDLRSDLSKLDQSARSSGAGLEEARGAFERFYQIAGETDSAIEATANLLQAGLTENRLQQAVEGLAGAVIQFPDTLNIESLADSLQETLATGSATGQFAELLDRLGIGAENFNEQLALCGDEISKQNLALSAMAQGGLMESYNGWLENNQALADNRQATLDLQLQMAELAESIQPLMTTILEIAQGLLEWFNNLDDGTKKAVVSLAFLAAGISPVADAVSGVLKVLPKFVDLLGNVDLKSAAIAFTFTLLAGLAYELTQAWDDMSGLERAAAVIGLVGAAALTAAIAVGAFSSAASMGLAAAGIVAGIAMVSGAILSAKQRAESEASNFRAPGLASGGLVPPGDPFLAVLGDNNREVEVVSPYSTIKRAVGEELDARGGGSGSRQGTATATLVLDGTRLGRAIFPYIEGESTRQGVRLTGGSFR